MNDKIRIIKIPEKFGREELNGDAQELLGLEISTMGRCGSDHFTTLEFLLSGLRLIFPDRFLEYDAKHEEMSNMRRKKEGVAPTAEERIPTPADRYFKSGIPPWNMSIPKDVCEVVS